MSITRRGFVSSLLGLVPLGLLGGFWPEKWVWDSAAADSFEPYGNKYDYAHSDHRSSFAYPDEYAGMTFREALDAMMYKHLMGNA